MLEGYTRAKTTKALQITVEAQTVRRAEHEGSLGARESQEHKLERQIAYCIIKAPGDGLVVYGNDPGRNFGNRMPTIEEGETVRERQLIFRLPDITRMQVNTKVRELHVDKLGQKMKARVRVDAFADAVLSGTVRDIAPLPNPIFPNQDIRFYTTHVAIDEALAGLRPGMTADVENLIYQADNVLSVPDQAILEFDGKYHVAVKKPGGGFDWRKVTLGQANDKYVEVKQGLQSGDV